MEKNKSFGTHDFSQCLIEGFSALDIVFDYFNNPDAKMPKFLEDYALLARDLKTQYKNGEISLLKASKWLVKSWEELLYRDFSFVVNGGGLPCIDYGEKESFDFVLKIFEVIKD